MKATTVRCSVCCIAMLVLVSKLTLWAGNAGPDSVSTTVSATRTDFMLGVDANYSLDMETSGSRWKWNGAEKDLFSGMQQEGVRWLRVRLWTGDQGVNGKAYAIEIVRRALRAGLTPYLVIFLSDDWADLMKQPVPAVWRNMTISQRANAVHAYSKDIVTSFRQQGLASHLYEIGNEIDYGVCGVYPDKDAGKEPQDLTVKIWPDTAKLVLAAQAGVKEADPEAKFLLHIAHWWDAAFCTAFFRFMIQHGVQVDYVGLTYFPSSNIGGSLTLEQFRQVVDAVTSATRRPLIIPETAYPSTTDFGGQFADWRNEVPGYPLTPEGQRKWLTDVIRFSIGHPAIAGVFYWSPEWYGEGMWKAFALFDVQGEAKPAWKAFSSTGREVEGRSRAD